MKKLLLLLLVSVAGISQNTKFKTQEISVNPLLDGTLYSPEKTKKTPLLILIAGSGPTDRDGNQSGAKNNSLKLLAESVAGAGTAVYSYDKRIIAQVKNGTVDESKLSFDDFINDAREVIAYFRSKKTYSKIIVGGHSEGSLIGMTAANGNADGFISIAGPGRSIDLVLTDQIVKQAPFLKEELVKDFAILKKGETFENKNQMLQSIFKPSLQPYMISWIKYEPTVEIKKLKIPVLIVNGTKDYQVWETEAELLKEAKPDAKYVIIPDMNHVFKTIKGDDAENLATYSNPDLPISEALSTAVNQFIKTL